MKMQPIPFGKYLLLDRVNVGGMAEVFKAKAFGVEGFERLVAVKRILPSIAEDEDFVTMFVDEAKIAVQLTHANIAQIFDLGKADDSYYIALEYVHGKDLRTIFERARRQSQPIPMMMACHIMSEVCEGLDYAHNKRGSAGEPLNLVHRDVSPQNILISYDGEVKLIDFGIAKAAGKAGVTQAGMLKGKFGYMSPEQVNGVPLDRRSDIFTAGIVLWELLAGERLFVAETDFATLDKVRTADIMSPSTYNEDVPEELDRIVLKALSKEMDGRYQTAMALHDDLMGFLYGQEQRFSRNDLSSYMRDVFSAELAKELRADEALRQFAGSTIVDPKTPASFSFPEGLEGRTLEDRAIAVGVERPPTGPKTLGDPAAQEAVRASRVPATPHLGGVTPPTPPPRTAPFVRPATGEGIAVSWDEEDVSTEIFDKPGEMKKIPSVVPPPSSPSVGNAHSSAPRYNTAPPPSSTPPPLPSSSVPPPLSGSNVDTENYRTDISASSSVRPPRTTPMRSAPPPSRSSRSSEPSIAGHAGAVAVASTKMAVPVGGNDENPETIITGGDSQAVSNLPTQIGDEASFPSAPSNLPTQIGDESSLPDSPALPLRHEPPVVSVSSPPPIAIPATESRAQDTADDGSKKKLLLIAAAALAAVLVLGVIGVLVFGGSSPAQLTITTEPAKVQLFVDGKPISGESPFVVSELDPGAHSVEIRANGFEQYNDSAELSEGEQRPLNVVLEPIVRLGGFTFNTSPPGAKVYLDDDLIGTTPVSKDNLEPGVYVLRAEHDGNFLPFERTVPIREGQQRPLPTVNLQPDKVVVTFTSDPEGADVTLIQGDVRKSLGSTPARAEIRMSAGDWSVEIKKRGYELWTQPLSSIGGQEEFEVDAVLTREGSGGSSDSSRSRDREADRDSNRTASSSSSSRRTSGSSDRSGRDSNRNTSSSSSSLSSSRRTSSSSSSGSAAAGGEGVLAVNSIPWSQVYVDGRLIGNTPRPKVPLKTGHHTVTLVRTDLDIKKKLSITIKKGETTKKIVKLLE